MLDERLSLLLVQDGDLRIYTQVVKVFLRQVQAEAAEGGDVRRVEQRQLLIEPGPCRRLGGPRGFFHPLANPLAHLRRGRVSEGHHQNVFERTAAGDLHQAAFNERAGFARARARHHQHVARGGNRSSLRISRRAHLAWTFGRVSPAGRDPFPWVARAARCKARATDRIGRWSGNRKNHTPFRC